MTEMIGRGDQIEAKVGDVNNEKRVLSVRHIQ